MTKRPSVQGSFPATFAILASVVPASFVPSVLLAVRPLWPALACAVLLAAMAVHGARLRLWIWRNESEQAGGAP